MTNVGSREIVLLSVAGGILVLVLVAMMAYGNGYLTGLYWGLASVGGVDAKTAPIVGRRSLGSGESGES